MLSYEQARQKVIEQVGKKRGPRATFVVRVWDESGVVLQQEDKTDSTFPPFHRSTRDGYAGGAAEARAGAKRRCAGEIKAGDAVTQTLAPGTCVQIMTGAAVPPGADAVVMIEHAKLEGQETAGAGSQVWFERDARAGQNIVAQGSEAASGQTILTRGMRLGYAELALAAQVGVTQLTGAKKPRLPILSTGAERLPLQPLPRPF